MDYVMLALVCFASGAAVVFFALDTMRRTTAEQQRRQEAQVNHIRADSQAIDVERRRLAEESARIDKARADAQTLAEQVDKRVVSHAELQGENGFLKGSLRNLEIAFRKLRLDVQQQQQTQEALDARAKDLGGRYLKESVKWIGVSLNANNYAACKQRLLDVIRRCREAGLPVSESDEAAYVTDLKQEFERAVKAAIEREEQARIKAQIREEQQREREVDRELKQAAREREAIEGALAEALARAAGEHSAEVERLSARLAEAEARSQRAVSQAQLTKAGYVYVISNIGSFGEGVFKVGMTRRLEPLDRVRELGDASVPFPFDVHMMISCDDAPALELALHRSLHRQQVNKTNPRKEFFRADIESIRRIVLANYGEVAYVADPEALQYRQSLTMSDEDLEFIEEVYEEAEGEERPAGIEEL